MSQQILSETEDITKNQLPKMYKVHMHNDDYTPMDFVVQILKTVFKKQEPEATNIMFEVHNKGLSCVGIYTYDIAHSKKIIVDRLSSDCGYPLKVTMTEVS